MERLLPPLQAAPHPSDEDANNPPNDCWSIDRIVGRSDVHFHLWVRHRRAYSLARRILSYVRFRFFIIFPASCTLDPKAWKARPCTSPTNPMSMPIPPPEMLRLHRRCFLDGRSRATTMRVLQFYRFWWRKRFHTFGLEPNLDYARGPRPVISLLAIDI